MKRAFSALSATTVERLASASASALFFLVAAIWLPKEELGKYAWGSSIGVLAAGILSVGAPTVVVRRVAADASCARAMVGEALLHRCLLLVAGLLVSSVVAWAPCHLSASNRQVGLFILMAFGVGCIGQCSAILKQALVGRHEFWSASLATQASSVAKVLVGAAAAFAGGGAWGLLGAVLCSYLIEGVTALLVYARKFRIWLLPRHSRAELGLVLREGMPLAGAALFDSVLARADWILIGIWRSEAEVAEYAFAYRIFEMCWLPSSAVASVMLPKVTSLYTRPEAPSPGQKREATTALLKSLILLGSVPAIAVAVGWSPIVDWLTAGKYGTINAQAIMFLTLATPFVGGTAGLWSIGIALKRTGRLPLVMAAVALWNVALDVVLVPALGGPGAAMGMLGASMLQFALYVAVLREAMTVTNVARAVVGTTLATALAVALARHARPAAGVIPMVVATYVAVLALGRVLRRKEVKDALSVLSGGRE